MNDSRRYTNKKESNRWLRAIILYNEILTVDPEAEKRYQMSK